MCCPGKRAAAAARERGYGPPFGPFAARGRGCGRGGGQCRGPPRFIRALFGRGDNRNASGHEELGEAGYGQGVWSGEKKQPQQQQQYQKQQQREQGGYPSSSKYQDFPLEDRSGKAPKAEGDGSESDEEYDVVEEKTFKETTALKHESTARKHESKPPRYSQITKR